MRNEDVDWSLFHLIPENETRTISELVEKSGFSRDEVVSSLARLEKNRLIQMAGEIVHALSINDMFILNEVCNSAESDIYIENGIIKVRK
mgnify:CR=1 FL=1|jgi:hypothetical protein